MVRATWMGGLGLLTLLSGAGCADPAPAPAAFEPAVPALECGRPEVMFAVSDGGAGTFGGFDGALTPGTQARLLDEDGSAIGELTADAEGRFTLAHGASAGDRLTLEACGATISFRVRDPNVARAAAVQDALGGGVGAVPNDLIVVGGAAAPLGVVVRTGDNALSGLDWASGALDAARGVRLPDVAGGTDPVPASPWLAAAFDAAARTVLVTAWEQGEVYLVDLEAASLIRTLPRPAAVPLPEPFTLQAPFDVDGDGTPEATVDQIVPGNPQPVAVVGGRVLVAYANLLRLDRGGAVGQIALPGVLASYDAGDLDLAPVVRRLPCFNPQEIRAAADGSALVTCSGLFRIQGLEPQTPSAVLRVAPDDLEVIESRTFERALVTTAVELEGRFWAGSLARAEVIAFGFDAQAPASYRFNEAPVDSVFRLVQLQGGLLGVPSFNTDRLHVFDPRTGAIDPLPFGGPLALGPGGDVFSGLQIVARRPGRAGVDFTGPDLMALSGLAARVTVVELRKVLGP